MSDINFCNTKEQLNHLGEVVTGKVDGSPTGADIDTSTLPYTGQVRKTLPALEEEYQDNIDNFVQVSDQVIIDKTAEFDASIANKESEADAAIDAYRLLSKGPYAAGILLEDKFQYITYNGESYFATNPPYTTTATTPDADVNLFAGGYVNEPLATQISETVLEENVSKYTDIVYKDSGGNSAFENMLQGNPIASNAGDICKEESNTWKRVSVSSPSDNSDFELQNNLFKFNSITYSIQNHYRNIGEKFKDMYDVKDSGVVYDDPSASTSNTAVIQTLFNLGVIKFYFGGIGICHLDPLDLSNQSGVLIRGFDRNSTVLQFSGVVQDAIKIGNLSGLTNSGGEISDMTISGTRVGSDWRTQTYNTTNLIKLGAMVNGFIMRRLRLFNANNLIESTTSSLNFNREFNDIECYWCVNGLVSSEANANKITKLLCYQFQGTALDIAGFGMEINGNSFESSSSDSIYGVKLLCRGGSVTGNYFEGIKKALEFKGSASSRSNGVNYSGNYMVGTGQSDPGSELIKADATDGVVISGNFLRRAESAIIGGTNCVNTFASNNKIDEVSNRYSGNIGYQDGAKIQMSGLGSQNLHAELSGKTRNQLEASLIKSNYTTLDNLLDVRVNDSPYGWRTYIGGADGADGGARPTRDNTQNFGSASNRWAEIFSGNAAINTSDEREKTFEEITDAENKCAKEIKGLIKKFKWNDAIKSKGNDFARVHFGVGAQTVARVFKDNGLDPDKYSLFCYDEWSEEVDSEGVVTTNGGNRFGIRYSELTMFILSSI